MAYQHEAEFNYKTHDKHGLRAIDATPLTGAVLTHANGKRYTIYGFVWLGESDEWGFFHASPEGVACARPLSHILGRRRDGSPRYTMDKSVVEFATALLAKVRP